MASFFAIPNSIQKRLLRYTLSQLDFLDPESLDLDNLDIAFGRRSTIDLKDLKLKREKLSSLLGVPGAAKSENVRILDARVLRLRLEVPADIYSSGISVEIDGIEVRVQVSETQEKGSKDVKGRAGSKSRTRFTGSKEQENVLPTAQDITASFLAGESPEERKELEAAVRRATQQGDDDLAYGSDESDEESDEGTGTGLALPGFLTGFLNGIVDRLQVTVRNVAFTLEIRAATSSVSKEVPTSLRLSVREVDIDGITTSQRSGAVDRKDKRGIHLRQIVASLLTDPTVFARSFKSPPAMSPAMSRSSTTIDALPISTHSPHSDIRPLHPMVSLPGQDQDGTHDPPLLSKPTQRADTSQSFGQSASSQPTPASYPLVPHGLDLGDSVSTIHNEASRYGDADGEADNTESNSEIFAYQPRTRDLYIDPLGNNQYYSLPSESSLLGSSRRLDPDVADPTESAESSGYLPYQDSVTLPTPSQLFLTDELLPSMRASSPTRRPPTTAMSQGSSHLSPISPSTLFTRIDERKIVLSGARTFEDLSLENSSSSPARSDSSGSGDLEDLTQSKVFTQGEAESMYMSAMSAMSDVVQSQVYTDKPSNISRDPESSKILIPPAESFTHTSPLEPSDGNLGTETPRACSPAVHHSPFGNDDNASQIASPAISTSQEMDARRLVDLDLASIWVPWAKDTHISLSDKTDLHTGAKTQSCMPDQSLYQTMPGAFSIYAEARSSQTTLSSNPRLRFTETNKEKPIRQIESDKTADLPDEIRVELGRVVATIDLAVGGLLHKLLSTVSNAIAKPDSMVHTSGSNDQPQNSGYAFQFSIKSIIACLVERLPVVMSDRNTPGSSSLHDSAEPIDGIVQLKCRDIAGSMASRSDNTKASLEVRSFKLGTSTHDFIAFDSDASMRNSVRDLRKQKSIDVSLGCESNGTRGTEIHIDTLPIILTLDLQQLDEQLGCFGGLSGILDLSQSIIGENQSLKSPRTSYPPVRGTPFSADEEATEPAPLFPIKLNARISGVLFRLQGKSCGLSLHSTAVKAAVRADYAGIQIDKIKFAGPFLSDMRSDAPLVCNVENASIRFPPMPNEDDLDSFVSLITPSRDRYEDDDDIILDTLLRQRKKGSIVKVQISNLTVKVHDIDGLKSFSSLGDDLAKLSSVTKYLPEDDRPGLLSFITIQTCSAEAMVGETLGLITLKTQRTRAVHIGLPALYAVELGEIAVSRQQTEQIVGPLLDLQISDQLPMVMIRQIGGELEPTIKAKLFNIGLDYRVPTVMAALGLNAEASTEELATSIASSIATLRGASTRNMTRQSSGISDGSKMPSGPLHLDLLFTDCALGLNPLTGPARAILLLSNAKILANVNVKDHANLAVNIRKGSLLAADNIHHLDLATIPATRAKSSEVTSPASTDLERQGYRSLVSLSSTEILVRSTDNVFGEKLVQVDVHNELFVLESCADSTQTLFEILGGLSPPSPPSSKLAYRTEVMPIEDIMRSFTEQTYETTEASEDDMALSMENADQLLDDLPTDFDLTGSVYLPEDIFEDDPLEDFPSISAPRRILSASIGSTLGPTAFLSMEESFEYSDTEALLEVTNNYLHTMDRRGALRVWNSKTAQYGVMYQSELFEPPLKLKLSVGTFIWNLYDGYDWEKTRSAISRAVDQVQERAEERRRQRQAAPQQDDDEESEVGDFLFQSIWIAVPPNREAEDLRRQINRGMDETASETDTLNSVAESKATSRPVHARRRSGTLRLDRSKRHKMSIELRGVDIDVLVAPPDTGETQSTINLRVRDFEIFDHIPSSTWKKFATYMKDAGVRELGKPQLHAEILNVKPIPTLAASELVIKIKVLPIRLHVDQDALDFITRFFEFKAEKGPYASPSEPSAPPFIQRLEVNSIKVKLDYKPKRVDYAGIRSGHAAEFKNFVTLDRASFTLRHVILYGVAGPDRLNKMLNDIWMPDVKFNQLPGVLSGLAPVRPLVDVGAGVRNLVAIPMREYRRDGRLVRSVRKGAVAFAKTTTSELARLGAKVAIGTQNVLEGAEQFLAPPSTDPVPPRAPDNSSGRPRVSGTSFRVGLSPSSQEDWDDTDFPASPLLLDENNNLRAISNYADQPLNVLAGVRSALRHLEKDLLTTRDAVIAIGGEIRDAGTPAGVAGAVVRHAPTVILRPVIGSVRAVGTALLGAGNALDGDSRRKIEDKYKRT